MVVVEIEWKPGKLLEGNKTRIEKVGEQSAWIRGTAIWDSPTSPRQIHLLIAFGGQYLPLWLSDTERVEVYVK